jgi:glutamyl-tRNA synthetase
VNWRFRVPDGEVVEFADLNLGEQRYVAGISKAKDDKDKRRDFGDFLVWRRDDVPAYQLAVVADDEAMRISEIVRGADLLKSTARQLLLIRALGYAIPNYFHCELVRDSAGVRLAKRHDALSIRHLRESGLTPKQVLEMAGCR